MKKIMLLCLFFLLSTFNITAFSLSKLKVVLDGSPNSHHAPLIIAHNQGFFKAQGLIVDLIDPHDRSAPAKWIAANKADIGITYQPAFMQQVDKNLPLIRIGTLIDKPLNCLVVLKEGSIKTLADLRGKRIGSTSNGLTSVMIKVMLEKQDIPPKDINLINIKDNLTQALLSHKVDAVTGLMRNIEVPVLELHGHEAIAFFPEEHGIPTYSELIFITNIRNVHDKRFPRFLSAIKAAVAYLDAHPKETWEAFAKQYPKSNNSVNRESWFATMPYFAEDPASFNANEWENFAQFMQKNQLIKKTQAINRYCVTVG
jgi:putative hydroxymethylpyrimidine transport system substrate-binding protein